MSPQPVRTSSLMLFLNDPARCSPESNRMYFAWAGPLGSGLCPQVSDASSPVVMFWAVQLLSVYPFDIEAARVLTSAELPVPAGSALAAAAGVRPKVAARAATAATRRAVVR